MEIIVSNEALLTPLQAVVGVVDRRPTLSILSHVLLEFNEQQVIVTGTDSEVELKGCGTLSQPVSSLLLTVPAKKLLDICRSLPLEAVLTLFIEEHRVTLSAGNSRFTLSTLPHEEFPLVKEQPSELEISLPQNELKYLLEQTHFSMANQDVRYYLNGLSLTVFKKGIRAVATDGHRLALAEIKKDMGPLSDTFKAILPKKGVVELLRLLDKSEEDVTLSMDSHHLRILGSSFVVTSNLVDGQFPDYRRVMPSGRGHKLIADRALLKQALNRVAILSNEKYHGIRFYFNNNKLGLKATNPEQEEAEETLPVEYDGDTMELGVNVCYLQEVINTINSEKVSITVTDPNGSMLLEVFMPENTPLQEQAHSLFIVMPMRL